MIIISIGALFLGQSLFLGIQYCLGLEITDMNLLTGFYSVVFTAITIIIGIVAIIGWSWVKDSTNKGEDLIKEINNKLEKFKEVEKKVDFLHKEKELADWVKKKVEEDGIFSFEIKEKTDKDKQNSKDISTLIKENITDRAWLEVYLAHKMMTEEKYFDKAEGIFEYIDKKNLLEDKSNIQYYLNHFMGQLNWEKYKKYKKDKLDNLSRGLNENEIPGKVLKKAKKFLNKSIYKYYNAIKIVKKGNNNHNADPSKSNLALIHIELSKFYYNSEEQEILLNKAIENLKSITPKDFNHYYDLSRAYFYKGNMEEAQKYLNRFNESINDLYGNEKSEAKNMHRDRMDNEEKEFEGKGFPKGLINPLKGGN